MGTAAHAYNSSILGGQEERIAWAQKFKAAMSHDYTMALQPWWHSENLTLKKKKKKITETARTSCLQLTRNYTSGLTCIILLNPYKSLREVLALFLLMKNWGTS